MKKLFLLMVAIFTSVFVLVSCGNNNNNPGQTTGPFVSQCTHTYGNWTIVKQPTETEKGKAQRTCSACGAKEEMELPLLAQEAYNITATSDARKNSYQLKTNEAIVFEVTDHTGEIFCDDCGKDLTTDEFWANMVDSSKYDTLTVAVDTFTLKIGPANINLKDANLEVTFDDGAVKRVKGFVTKVDTVGENAEATKIETTYYFDFEDLVLYTAMKSEGVMHYDKTDFNKKTDATQLTNETETVIDTTSILTRENIVKVLYYIAKVTKDANNNLVVELDWTKIKNINKKLSEKSINEIIKDVTETDLISVATGIINMAALITYSDAVDMFEEQITQLEASLNAALAKIPAGMIPEHLTTLTDLIAYYLVQFEITTAEKVAGITNLKDLLLAIDPSTETTRVTIGDMLLTKLGVQLPLPEGKTYNDVIKDIIKSYLAVAFMQSDIDYEAVFKLVEEYIDNLLAYIPFGATITEVVSLLDIIGAFDKVTEVESKVNIVLMILDQLFPLDTTSVANLAKGLLVKMNKITATEAEAITSLKDVILLFDKSVPADPDTSTPADPYTLDEVIVDIFNITLNEGETASAALINKVSTFLNKTVYDLIIESGIVAKILHVEVTAEELYTLVDGMGIALLQNALVPKVTFGADGTIKEASLKLDGFGYININCVLKTNATIEMEDIRVEAQV